MSKIKKTLFIILANLIFFLLIEVSLTFFFFFHSSNYYGPLARLFLSNKDIPKKTIMYKIKFDKFTQMYLPGTYEFKNTINKVNEFGFLGQKVDIANKKNCRLIALGGSTTAGLESKETYPKNLEKRLNKNDINCDVLNFGFSGKALNYLEKILVTEAIKFSPNIIAIMSNRNATMYDSFTTSAVASDVIKSKFELIVYKIKSFLFLELMSYRFLNLTYNRLISLFLKDENKIKSPFNPKNFHSVKYFENGYRDQIMRINSFCKANDIKLLLIKQAFFINLNKQKVLNQLTKKQLIEKLKNYENEKSPFSKKDLFWMYTNAILNKSLDEAQNLDRSIVIIDPTTKLYSKKKEKYFQEDGLHLKDNGNKIIAETFFNTLINKKLVKTQKK